MDEMWTRPECVPDKLYRVICPGQGTHFDLVHGLMAGLTTPDECWLDSTDLKSFLESITYHREIEAIPSPYVSLFEDLNEAEMFCIAAADLHAENEHECYVVEIDTTHPEWKKADMKCWFVHDIQVMCPPGYQLGVGPRDGLIKGEKGGRYDSEWLALFWVPGGGVIKILKDAIECRISQQYFERNDLVAYEPPPHFHSFPAIRQTEEHLSLPAAIGKNWRQCTQCPNAHVCNHVGGFRRRDEGEVFEDYETHVCRAVGVEFEEAMEAEEERGWGAGGPIGKVGARQEATDDEED